MMQRLSLDDFWARYGRSDYDGTAFAKALSRLPTVKPVGPWIAGGAVRRLLSDLPQDSDFDFFFANQAQFDNFCAAVKAAGGWQTSESDFNVSFCLPRSQAKPVGDDEFEGGGPELKVQAIRIAFFETLGAVIDSFDFSICQFGFDGEDLVLGDWALFDMARKRLVPGKVTFGTSTLRRVIKYTRQGYTICGGGLASILEQVAADPTIIQAGVEYVD